MLNHPLAVVAAQVALAALPVLVLAESPSPSFPSWMLSLLLLLVELKLTLHRMLVLTWLVELVEPGQQHMHFVACLSGFSLTQFQHLHPHEHFCLTCIAAN